MIRALAILVAVLAGPAAAQQSQQVVSAPGAVLRVLDKANGTAVDLDLGIGETGSVGNLTVTLQDCRYPTENPSGDAFALMTIHYRDAPDPVFAGWMVASAPALNAMEHPRYDVWALRCRTS